MTFDTTNQTLANQRLWRRGRTLIFISVILLAIFGGAAYSYWEWGVFKFNETLATNFWNVFSKYFFIIVAMERAAAVWIGLDRSAKRRAWERRVNRMREFVKKPNPESLHQPPTASLADLRQMYHRESKIVRHFEDNAARGGSGFLGVLDPYVHVDGKPQFANKTEERELLMSYALVVKQIYEFKLTKFEEQSYKLVTRIVFVGGVVMAFIGLSILGDILSVDKSAYTKGQIFAYRIADVFVTGGLLGGGSKSFSVFLNTLNKLLNKLKDPQGES